MIAIIDYGVGNLTSILNMYIRLGIEAVVTHNITEIDKADKLLLPGIGHFDSCMKNFNETGLRAHVEKKVLQEKIPVLGICVGAQMMTRGSEEGREKGLNWVNADTIKFKLNPEGQLKVPHMGWTDLHVEKPSVLWEQLPGEPRFYFAHSYHFISDSEEMVIGKCDYGYEFACAFNKENIFGLQFHPEKSHRYGMKVLSNFARL